MASSSLGVDVYTELEDDCSDQTSFSDMLALYKHVRDKVPDRLDVAAETNASMSAISQMGSCHAFYGASYAQRNGI